MRSIHLLMLAGALFALDARAQVREAEDRFDRITLPSVERESQAMIPSSLIPLESSVDANRYFVGPSDVIAVNIWMSPPLNFVLTVTPEGTLIIPTVGEVRVHDMTLTDAKSTVIAEVQKKYRSPLVTVTLTRPRPIVVSVLGSVLNPGLYTLSAVDRVHKALEEANKPNRLQNQDDIAGAVNTMSTRNIVLKRRDGTQHRVDIPKFLAVKEDWWNPYLREGDVIIVPRRNLAKNVVAIYGEVNAPGRYEFVQGDSVLDALLLAQGFTRLARKDSVEFSRLDVHRDTLATQIIDLGAIRDGAPNIALESGDRLVVKARVDLREDYRVYVTGEVIYPGVYPITKNSTRLSDVIRQAGGFTEFAYPRIASLVRRSLNPAEIEIERMESLRGSVSPEDSAYYILETGLRIQKEVVNVDFERLFVHRDRSQDVILQAEDVITIPAIKKTIYVFGQVVSPGHVPAIDAGSVAYYVNQAGGYTERARRADTKIIKAKTRQWLSPQETTIEEGDYVWVPKEPERSFAYYMNVASQAASVLSVVVGIAVVIVQVTK